MTAYLNDALLSQEIRHEFTFQLGKQQAEQVTGWREEHFLKLQWQQASRGHVEESVGKRCRIPKPDLIYFSAKKALKWRSFP